MATNEQVVALVQKMHEERAALFAAVQNLAEADAEVRKPELDGEEGWSAKDQLAHLAWMDRTYRGWVTRALEEDDPDLGSPIDGGQAAPADAPGDYLATSHDLTVADHVRNLERERATSMNLIANLSLDQFDRTASNALFGKLNVMQWLRSYYRHDRQHASQIMGVESDYQPRFVGGQGEPDQRRS